MPYVNGRFDWTNTAPIRIARVPASQSQSGTESYVWNVTSLGLFGDTVTSGRYGVVIDIYDPQRGGYVRGVSGTISVNVGGTNTNTTAPVINSVSPSTLPSGQTTFTINGSGFQSGATVSYSGNSLGNYNATFSASFVSSGQLSVTGTGLAQGSSYMLFVRNPNGQTSSGCSTYTSCSSTLSVATPATTASAITVISPNGGGYWYRGRTESITWSSTNIPSNNQVLIRLRSVSTNQEHNLLTATANDGTESLVVPTSIPLGTYKLEIKTLIDSILDASDSYFTIVDPLVVTAPVINITLNGSAYDGSTFNTTFGGTVNIGWGVTPTSGTTCAAAGNGIGGGSGAVALSDGGRPWTTPALYTSTTYGIKCTNSAGTTYKYVSIGVPAQTNTTVTGNTAPTITLNGSNDSSRVSLNVAFGGTTTFTWGVSPTTGTSCSVAGIGVNGATGSGAVALSGVWTTPALYTNTTYGIACANTNSSGVPSGTTYKYADVTVAAQTNTTTAVVEVPAISSISPSPLPAGQTTFTINGSGFQSGATVSYSGNSLGNYNATFSASFVSANQLSVTGTGLAQGSSYMLFVRNPNGQTSSGCSTYTSCSSALSVAPATPAAVTYTAPTLSVSNSNPTTGTTISFTWSAPNGSGCYLSNNGVYNRALTSSPVSVDTTGLSGAYNVTASCSYPDYQTRTSNQVPVTVTAPATVAPAAPTISNFTPTSVAAGVNANIIVNGTNFRSGAVIVYSGTSSGELPVAWISTAGDQMSIGPYIYGAGSYTFRVKNTDGQMSGVSGTFVVTNAQGIQQIPTNTKQTANILQSMTEILQNMLQSLR